MVSVKLVLQGFLDLCETMKNYGYEGRVQRENLLELTKILATENCPNYIQTLSIQILSNLLNSMPNFKSEYLKGMTPVLQ